MQFFHAGILAGGGPEFEAVAVLIAPGTVTLVAVMRYPGLVVIFVELLSRLTLAEDVLGLVAVLGLRGTFGAVLPDWLAMPLVGVLDVIGLVFSELVVLVSGTLLTPLLSDLTERLVIVRLRLNILTLSGVGGL